jgi:hypothetical protein
MGRRPVIFTPVLLASPWACALHKNDVSFPRGSIVVKDATNRKVAGSIPDEVNF